MTDLCVRMCGMVRKSIILLVALLLSLSALAQSERLYLDTDFDFDFDNTEYSGSGLGASETLFGISLAPVFRYEWNDKHSFGVGVNMQKMFGSVRFLDDIDLVAYYQFKGEKYGTVAGLFRREKMIGHYSEAFFSSAWLADNRLVQGLALQYHDKVGFAELAVDWNGMYSLETREQFRILFSGEGRFAKVMYAGASAAMQHYANRADFQHNVVDNFTINPYIGVDFNAFFDFDIRLGYLQSLQRDRVTGGGLAYSDGWRIVLPNEPLGCLYLEQYLCRQKSATAIQLGGQGGYDIWCRPLRLGPLLWNNNRNIQSYGHRLRAQLLEGAHQGQGGICIENRRQEVVQSADYFVGGKPCPETLR